MDNGARRGRGRACRSACDRQSTPTEPPADVQLGGQMRTGCRSNPRPVTPEAHPRVRSVRSQASQGADGLCANRAPPPGLSGHQRQSGAGSAWNAIAAIMSPMSELPVGTVTLLFTDVGGSTELVKSLQERYAETLAAHRELLRAAFADHPWPDGASVAVRMGMHTGEPYFEQHGYTGLPVHRAARICTIAHPGQVLLSR